MITDADVEKVARRMCVHLGLDPDETDALKPDWGGPMPNWRYYKHIARDAIAARRAIDDLDGLQDTVRLRDEAP